MVAGGVGANLRLRERLQALVQAPVGGPSGPKPFAKSFGPEGPPTVPPTGEGRGRVYFPRPAFCTDNGAMIAFAGALRLQAGQHEAPVVTVTPRWDMASLPPL
ncbi:hypothetical protein GCM10027266_01310 [Arenimonas alkanexedens]